MASTDKVRGVNLGNWLVLEKWMNPELFAGTDAEDETDLCAMLPGNELKTRLKTHRDTYITLKDFQFLAGCGLTVLRLPVPHFVFDDYAPYVGCIEYVDKAFEWAQFCGLKILIDLHTVPESQNGFDNGGICGVCKWHLEEKNVQRTLMVLEKLAIRYKGHPALYGIQFVNEPISPELFEMLQTQERYPPRDKLRAEGSCGVPTEFLYDFYTKAYHALRRHLDDNVVMMFHDGFRFKAWNDFMRGPEYQNVVLDTHIYLSFMLANLMGDLAAPETRNSALKRYMDMALEQCVQDIAQVRQFFPVVIGEWSVAHQPGKMGETPLMERAAITAMAQAQLYAWEQADGWFFWSYKLLSQAPGWDFRRMIKQGYFPQKFN